MFVLFEESGAFKCGTVLVDNDASLQVENTHGKRLKLKRSHVMLQFDSPAAGELLPRAEAESESLDIDFLWEVCGDDEFGFAEFAAEYFGHTPSTVEATAVLLRLHSAPIYFHRKGRGRFRKAPPDILQAALAGLEKKRQQAEAIDRMRDELLAHRLPAEFEGMVPQLLYRPDRNRLETKALEAACVDSGLSAANLMLACGALQSSYDFHYGRFLFDFFPDGEAFPEVTVPTPPDDLPIAPVRAFSIDDATTTEIDDAFSVTPRAGGGWTVGIHIAAPGLGLERGSALDAIARQRLSTVYMPGNKITMLPDSVVEAFTLQAGRTCPAVSLYLELNADLSVAQQYSRLERIPVEANLRHHDLEPVFNEHTLVNGGPDYPWKQELTLLWELATIMEAGRGKPATNQTQTDYSFYVDWDVTTADGPGAASITPRLRGAPLDKLVAELMIVANSTWGKRLDEAGIPGIYRVQGGGKVRMATAAAPHEGLGVDCYAWSSSPLRRYVDLVNQWQLISVLREDEPVFPPKSPELMEVVRDFDVAYSAYAEFQRHMERYWCIRALRWRDDARVTARVLRENVVRIDDMPFVFKVGGMPLQVPGAHVALEIKDSDLLDVDLRARFVSVLSEPTLDEAASE
ncbi:RNB domain-containing ribonuclease [Nitrogeniibacter mangrovi]|uniref:RNB domain-containing ribonuclease n=1 Tax=Nitrogeniibacter mangrovi TaxID=2016596 RepID=A0A6C1B3K5_9RHOO|nr:RNB domain-containing ribonuclease [Nitrogeniibacter mangrovi]QID16910.1 RNB domain-containing ribonuclease [Nitrogeniibacter mangrovi]